MIERQKKNVISIYLNVNTCILNKSYTNLLAAWILYEHTYNSGVTLCVFANVNKMSQKYISVLRKTMLMQDGSGITSGATCIMLY